MLQCHMLWASRKDEANARKISYGKKSSFGQEHVFIFHTNCAINLNEACERSLITPFVVLHVIYVDMSIFSALGTY